VSRRSIIAATIALFAAGAAVLVAFDEASARSFRGGAGMSRAGMARGASMGSRGMMGARSMGTRSLGARNVGQRAMGRSAFSPRGGRMAMPRRSAGAALSRPGRMGSPSRLGRNALGSRTNGQTLGRGGLGRSASSQFGRGRPDGRRNALGSRQAGLGSRQNGIGSRQTDSGRSDPRSTGFSSRQAANQPANGRSLPRPDLGRLDRNRNAAASDPTGRRYENMNGPMNGSSMPGNQQANNNPQSNPPQSGNQPKPNNPPRSGNGSRPDAKTQILIDWRNTFVRGVRGGATYDPGSAGTLFSVCQNMATLCAGGSVPFGAWLWAPAPGWGSTLFQGAVDAFTPADPNDPLSTPFDNGVRNAVKGAQSFDLNPFDNIAPPPAWNH